MMFVGRVPFAQLGRLLGVVIAAAVICVLVIVQYGKDDQDVKNERQPKTALVETVRGTADDDEAGEPKRKGVLHRLDTWKSRINGFLSPEVPPEKYDLDKDAQKAHALRSATSSRRRSPISFMPSSSKRWALSERLQ